MLGRVMESDETTFTVDLEHSLAGQTIALALWGHAHVNLFVWNQDEVSVSLRYYRSEGRGEITYTYLPLALKGQKGDSD